MSLFQCTQLKEFSNYSLAANICAKLVPGDPFSACHLSSVILPEKAKLEMERSALFKTRRKHFWLQICRHE